jgi:hypothetical protein
MSKSAGKMSCLTEKGAQDEKCTFLSCAQKATSMKLYQNNLCRKFDSKSEGKEPNPVAVRNVTGWKVDQIVNNEGISQSRTALFHYLHQGDFHSKKSVPRNSIDSYPKKLKGQRR